MKFFLFLFSQIAHFSIDFSFQFSFFFSLPHFIRLSSFLFFSFRLLSFYFFFPFFFAHSTFFHRFFFSFSFFNFFPSTFYSILLFFSFCLLSFYFFLFLFSFPRPPRLLPSGFLYSSFPFSLFCSYLIPVLYQLADPDPFPLSKFIKSTPINSTIFWVVPHILFFLKNLRHTSSYIIQDFNWKSAVETGL